MVWLVVIAILVLLIAIVLAVIAAYSIMTARALDNSDTATAHRNAVVTSVVSFVTAFVALMIFIALLYFYFRTPTGSSLRRY
jgi:Na+-driven multidrug efflux pump